MFFKLHEMYLPSHFAQCREEVVRVRLWSRLVKVTSSSLASLPKLGFIFTAELLGTGAAGLPASTSLVISAEAKGMHL